MWLPLGINVVEINNGGPWRIGGGRWQSAKTTKENTKWQSCKLINGKTIGFPKNKLPEFQKEGASNCTSGWLLASARCQHPSMEKKCIHFHFCFMQIYLLTPMNSYQQNLFFNEELVCIYICSLLELRLNSFETYWLRRSYILFRLSLHCLIQILEFLWLALVFCQWGGWSSMQELATQKRRSQCSGKEKKKITLYQD